MTYTFFRIQKNNNKYSHLTEYIHLLCQDQEKPTTFQEYGDRTYAYTLFPLKTIPRPNFQSLIQPQGFKHSALEKYQRNHRSINRAPKQTKCSRAIKSVRSREKFHKIQAWSSKPKTQTATHCIAHNKKCTGNKSLPPSMLARV